MSIVAVLFWFFVAIIAYAYLLYPLLVWSMSRLLGRPIPCPPATGDAPRPAVARNRAPGSVVHDRIPAETL